MSRLRMTEHAGGGLAEVLDGQEYHGPNVLEDQDANRQASAGYGKCMWASSVPAQLQPAAARVAIAEMGPWPSHAS